MEKLIIAIVWKIADALIGHIIKRLVDRLWPSDKRVTKQKRRP